MITLALTVHGVTGSEFAVSGFLAATLVPVLALPESQEASSTASSDPVLATAWLAQALVPRAPFISQRGLVPVWGYHPSSAELHGQASRVAR